MAQIIDMKEYRNYKMLKDAGKSGVSATRKREFFMNLYRFLNKNLENEFDEILVDFHNTFVGLTRKHKVSSHVVNFFHIPMITFMVMVFLKNSDLREQFPELSSIENSENIEMFKETLMKILEYYTEDEMIFIDPIELEKEMDDMVQRFYATILTTIPSRIILI
ncbi:hypothetical protein [Alkaliphilus hydrothermalis]|uniref:Uncharacterized protein n=1 Tax=Alkaliphilus hydrothermalis TaxID=1482730 RepID=A0ABS2NPG9_9FIRM|nr:hypothetical protein [Alkaliphilus hydrothermalis]MBM7614830.1 hypothetical protein [Alkaliphilus hydrothermalis]